MRARPAGRAGGKNRFHSGVTNAFIHDDEIV